MSTPKPAPTFDPAVPMTAKWRSDIAWRLANGWTWKELAETLSCDADDLRFATETDPEFAEAQERAWTRVIFDGEADAMRRLRQIANTGADERASHAAEVLAKYAAERRENDTRLAIEKMRVGARIRSREKLKNERHGERGHERRCAQSTRGSELLPAGDSPGTGDRRSTREAL